MRATAARHKNSVGLIPFGVFSSLLMAVLVLYVSWLMPPKTTGDNFFRLYTHQQIKYSVMAQRLVVAFLPEPPAYWSDPIKCDLLGHGIWCATGGVQLSLPGSTSSHLTYWKVIFEASTAKSLYLRVGARTEGDYTAAVRAAGIQSSIP